jgi:hypothetical protein
MLHSFLFLIIIPGYRYAIFCLFIAQLVDIWVVPTFLAMMSSAAVNIWV